MRENIGIMDIVHLTNSIRIKRYRDAGISFEPVSLHGSLIPMMAESVLLLGLTSGLDVALTLMEESVGKFNGLSVEQASNIVNYFRKEAERNSTDEIAIWYLSWADAVEEIYLKNNLH